MHAVSKHTCMSAYRPRADASDSDDDIIVKGVQAQRQLLWVYINMYGCHWCRRICLALPLVIYAPTVVIGLKRAMWWELIYIVNSSREDDISESHDGQWNLSDAWFQMFTQLCTQRLKTETVVEYFKDDPQLPTYATPSCGYTFHELIDILLKPDMLNISALFSHCSHTKCSICGWCWQCWFQRSKSRWSGIMEGNGHKKDVLPSLHIWCCTIHSEKTIVTCRCTVVVYLLTRSYFIHKTYDDIFHRVIADIRKFDNVNYSIFKLTLRLTLLA